MTTEENRGTTRKFTLPLARGRLVSQVALAALLLAGCRSASKPVDPTVPPPIQLAGSRWQLIAIGAAPPQGGKPITLELGADGRASGFAGVNQFSGLYEAQASGPGRGPIRFGELASTRMAGPPELMEQENAFLEALRQAQGYIAEGGMLELGVGRDPLLRFRQLSPAAQR